MAGWSGGVYTRFRNWVTDKANSVNPQASLFDQEDDGFAAGLNNCVTKDGLNKPSAAMDWNGQNLTGVLNFANTGTVSLIGGKLTMSLAGNISVSAPSSGATATLNMVDGSAGAVIFDSGAPTTGYRLQFQQNGAIKGFLGLGANTFTGAAVGDFGIASNSTVLRFSSDGGTTTHAQISAGLMKVTDQGGTLQDVGWRDCPQNAQAGNYTTILADRGKSLVYTGGGASTFTIAANASVAYPLGTVLTFANRGGANLSIAINTDTLILAGTATTGTRTLTSSNGVATAIKTDTTVWLISGSGLT